MMNKICNINNCTGCYACYNVCKHDAIQFLPDKLFFFKPHIDNSKCINCGLCSKICPVNTQPALHYPIECYASTLIEESDIIKSASGGAATALMRNIIQQNGIVYGVSNENIFNIKHIRIERYEELDKLRGSKYVQSSINNTFSQCLADLKNNKIVLFIGTPCQIAGLKSFLRKDYDNLYTVDLVCHGVPSQKMLNDNLIKYNYSINNSSNLKVSFRKKIHQDNSYKIKYGFFLNDNDKHIDTPYYKDYYMMGFLSCLTFRESCYNCRYATSSRVSDITLADFWGLGNDAKFIKGKGVSACLLNTDKGIKLFQQAREQMIVCKREIVEAIIGNGQLQCPSKRHEKHTLFRELYPTNSFEYAIKSCLRKEIIKLKYIIPVKLFIKHILRLKTFFL